MLVRRGSRIGFFSLGAVLSGVLILLASPSAADAPPPPSGACLDNADCLQAAYRKSIDAAKHGQYMQGSFGLLADLGVAAPDKIRDEDVFDQWSQVWSAMTGAPADNANKAASRHVGPEEIAAIEAAQARPAIAEIVARAKRTRVVILDEDHLVPRDRAFGLEVARALRPLGYAVLAVETLTRDKDDAVSLAKMQAIAKDGYVRRSSGYYINDPVFADFLRQSMAMGYGLVSYESAGFTDETTEDGATVRREQEQAENILRRALERNPNAKVLVYCGFHHAAKTELAGDTVKGRLYMAARLMHLTGIDPLVIDQAEFGEALYRPDVDINALASRKATSESVVLMSGDKPLVVGLLAGAVDLQVVHPTVREVNGRPGWLESLGRRPVNIPRSLLPRRGTRLVQAFLADEADEAIPIDQVLVTAGRPAPKLMLPGKPIRYAYQDDPRPSARVQTRLDDGVSAAPALSATVTKKIDGDVKAVLHRFAVPGAAVMVLQNGHVSFVKAYGSRDPGRRLPVQPDTFFEIGSITKQFTAASVLQLQEAGKLQIDRPLSDYLPDAPHAKEVTLRQLLTHTSGLHDYLDLPPKELDRLVSRPISYSDLIARIAPLPLDFAPGSQWSYSNTGYLLLGKVIETVSGETYEGYLRRHILGPLHMTDTYTTADEHRLSNMATGYEHVDGKLEHAPIINPDWASAAGFLVAPMRDLAKWDEALRGGKVVSPASYREMTTPFMTTKNGSADYGLGLFVDSAYGEPRIGHTGGSLGFTTADEYFPRQDLRIIAFTNLGDNTPEAGETLTNVVFANLYPDVAAKAQKPAPGENAVITQTVRAAFRELQTGKDYSRFAAHLRDKLASGSGARFVASLGPYGAPSAAIFKGVRQDAKDSWYDYVIQFGPGVSVPFAARIGPDGSVAGLSVG